MPNAIAGLRPQRVWRHFWELCRRPCSSWAEGPAREYVVEIAHRHLHAAVTRDSAGNVAIDVPPTPGCETAPRVGLQAHLDMVLHPPGATFDAETIRLRVAHGWLSGTDTSIGADNRIGVALALAAAEDRRLRHGPLRLLFTVAEELGLKGAEKLDAGFLDLEYLVNLDGNHHDRVEIGSAGSRAVRLECTPAWEAIPARWKAYRVRLDGLRGGHSGLEINLGRGNAIRLLSQLLNDVGKQLPFRIEALSGGSPGSIPPTAEATIWISPRHYHQLGGKVAAFRTRWHEERVGADRDARITLRAIPGPSTGQVMDARSHNALLSLLSDLPAGVLGMRIDVPHLVATSSTPLRVITEKEVILVDQSTRSFSADDLARWTNEILARAGRHGFTLAEADMPQYPPWTSRADSPLLALYRGAYRNVVGAEPSIAEVHAGLECGVIVSRRPSLDAIAIGPDIVEEHTTRERVRVASVAAVFRALGRVLHDIGQVNGRS